MLRGIAAYMRRHHLALLALFVALGGTSVAAGNALLPKNSVGSPQVINGSLQKGDLSARAQAQLRGARGAPGARGAAGPTGPAGPIAGAAGGDLTGTYPNPQIAPNAVGTAEIADFSLANEDVGVLFAQVNADGTVANSSGGVTATRLGLGTYEVDFGRDISSCAFLSTQGEAGVGGAGGAITGVTDRSGNAEAVFATVRTDANALVDRAFQLVVVC